METTPPRLKAPRNVGETRHRSAHARRNSNLVGALGFTLCGAFGYAQAQYWPDYQSSLSTFWGGWAFLIGSTAQWVEALNR